MTEGSIFKTLLTFSLPMIIINVVQLLFHSADVAVLGIMADDADVAAVGACGSLISMLLCIFTGYASAANVIVAKRVGAQDKEGARRATGVAILMGLASGLILMTVTVIFARHFLIMTNCQPEILELATIYMRIYFLGMPFMMLYNFIASVLRATGDSLRPMIYMISSGVINVILNIVFVGFLNLAVAGVALATVISNFAAMVAALIALARNKGYCKIELKNLRFRKEEFFEMIRIGIPSCLGGIFFYMGEVVVVSSVNAVSADAMTANAISSQLDRFNYCVGHSIASAAGVMISQNVGSCKLDRVPKIMNVTAVYITSLTLALGTVIVLLATPLLSLFTDSSAVVELAKERLVLVSLTNFTSCSMEIMSGAVRALKRPMSVGVVGLACGLLIRGLWALFIFTPGQSLAVLFVSFPLSSFVAIIIYTFIYRGAMKSMKATLQETKCAV